MQNSHNSDELMLVRATEAGEMVLPTNSGEMITNEVVRRTTIQVQRHRPKKTNDQYDPKVKEYRKWCDTIFASETVETRYTVTEAKLVAFLQMKVIGRQRRSGGGQIGIQTVRAYKNAIVDLYKTQRSQNVNNNLHPGEGRTIKDLMKSLRRDASERMRRNYHDRGRASFRMKSLGKPELKAITDYQWSRSEVHNGLRDDMSEFNMRAMSVRGDHMRMLELPDLFQDQIEGQGVGECRAIVAVLNRGKTNQFGKAEFAGTMRHQDVFMCAKTSICNTCVLFFVSFRHV